MTIERIDTKKQLQDFQKRYKLRPDWHEPDESGVKAVVKGSSFDNAGFWPIERVGSSCEKYVTLKVNREPVAMINLATLFAIACE